MTVILRDGFKKSYKKLPVEIQKAFKDKLLLMQDNIKHPSLRIKKMQGHSSVWEGSLTMKYRFTFEFIKGGVLIRNIGNHDETLDNP